MKDGMIIKILLIVLAFIGIVSCVSCAKQHDVQKSKDSKNSLNKSNRPKVEEVADIVSNKIFNVDNFGARPNDLSFDSGPAIRDAIADAIAAGEGAKVILSEGVYAVSPAQKYENYVNVNDCFVINSANSLTIEGNNTELNIMDPFCGVFLLSNCTNTIIKGITIDYKILPFIQGEIKACDAVKATVDYEVEPGFDLIEDKRLMQAQIVYGMLYDKDNKIHRKSSAEKGMYVIKEINKLNDNTYRLRFNRPDLLGPYIDTEGQLEVGDPFLVMYRRGGHSSFKISKAGNGVALEDVTVYSSPQLVAAINSVDYAIHIKNLKVMIRPDTGRWASSNGDCIHVTTNAEGPIVENCYFEGVNDDIINIKGRCYAVEEITNDRTIKVLDQENSKIAVGDGVGIIDFETGERKAVAVITKIERIKDYKIIEFDKAIPDIKAGGRSENADLIYNYSRAGKGFIIRNSSFVNSRRYGILLTGTDGVIENNIFKDLAAQAIMIRSTEKAYPDIGGTPCNIDVIGNTCENVGTSSAWTKHEDYAESMAAITIMGAKPATTDVTGERVMSNFNISGNTIKHTATRHGIFIAGIKDVIFKNNFINNDGSEILYEGLNSGVYIKNVGGLQFDNFTMVDPRDKISAAIYIGKMTDDTQYKNLNMKLANGVTEVLK